MYVKYRGLSFLWLVLLIVVGIKRHPILSQLDQSQAFYDFRMIFENFNLKTFKFVTTLTRRVRQNVKYRVAELTEFNTKFFWIMSEIAIVQLCNWSEQERLGPRNMDNQLTEICFLPFERKSVFRTWFCSCGISIVKTLWCRAFL